MTTLAPYDWLRKIPKELTQHDEPSPFGYAPELDNAAFLSKLQEIFQFHKLEMRAKPFELREAAGLKDGFEKAATFFIRIAPLKGELILLIPQSDLDRVLTSFADKDLHAHILEPEFKQAFTQFMLTETAIAFQAAFPDKTLTPQLQAENPFPEIEAAWVKDISFYWDKGTLSARLIVPNELRKAWKEKYQEKGTKPLGLYQQLRLDVHVEAGRTHLTRKDWQQLDKGDFIPLEVCHLQAKGEKEPGEKGRVLLTINHTPFFRARLKDGAIKILEYPLFYEIGTTMSMPPNKPPFSSSPNKKEAFNNDEELEENIDFEEEESEEFMDEGDESAPLPPTDARRIATGGDEKSHLSEQKPFRAEDIPLEIIIEAGRFQMTVQKLTELQPGSLIDLDIHPEQGVDLVVNGVCVAKGELLKVGETLGVRILDIAK